MQSSVFNLRMIIYYEWGIYDEWGIEYFKVDLLFYVEHTK